jgi:tetratricopeptide (TPR) repeat protein
MSHIHEALKKAQENRDVGTLKYSGILAANRRKKRRFGIKPVRWVLLSIIVILLAFFYNLWFNFPGLQTPDLSGKDPEHFKTALKGTDIDGSREIRPEKPKAIRQEEPQQIGSGRPQGIELGEYQPSRLDPPTSSKLGPPKPIRQGLSPPIVPEKPEVTYERARQFHKEGRLEEAKKLYEETLRLDPGHVDTLNNLGVLFIRKKDYLSAQRNLEKAVRLKPRYAEPFYNLACLKAITGDTKQALSYLQKAVSLDPTVRDWAQKDADLESLRQMPEFKELL